jgi:hypothetical protein
MQSDLEGPVNIGNPEYVAVDELVRTVIEVAGKHVKIRHVDGPIGVQYRATLAMVGSSPSAGAHIGRYGAVLKRPMPSTMSST